MSNSKTFYGINEEYFANTNCIHTAEEIALQPIIWNRLGKILQSKKSEISDFMEKLGNIGDVRVIFTGAGSSAFIGDALAPLIMKSSGIKAESIHTTDIVSCPECFLLRETPTLLVSFARSGNSPESVGAVEYARAAIDNLFEIAIVCDGTSNLYNLTAKSTDSLILVMPEGSCDKGFAMTSSVTAMLLSGFALFNLDKIDELVRDIATLSENVSDSGLLFTELASK